MMTSAGFLKGAREYRPVDSLLSGPAGGVVGARAAGNTAGMEKVLSFDMGGTSTDVARISGRPRLGYEQQIGPVRVAVPAVQIETVAAGGGSICRWVNGGLEVGPDSAGANPGPAAYGRGGPFTLTDVNLMLGCMDAERAGIPLSLEAARVAFGDLKAGMLRDGVELPRDEELLEGLRAIAVERMADAIRKVSLREGYDPMEYGLVAFGGAGPQHACAVAEKLGVTDILVPADAGLLSAWGLHRSRRERIVERLVLESVEALERCWTDTRDEMCGEAVAGIGEGSKVSQILFELRLAGQDSSLELGFRDWPEPRELAAAFAGKYRRVYGYDPPAGRTVEVVMSRVVGAEEVQGDAPETFSDREAPSQDRRLRQDAYRTCVIEPGWSIAEGENGSLRLRREAPAVRAEHWSQPVEAELFRCRFENVVEEMGELLRRTAISTNVKERLDYSCALLDADGFLIVNAPHIPVHLGAIGVCVRTVSTGRRWAGGDMLVVNHPAYGGSHLPDITLISPVFDPSGGLVGFVANRAHHAELGGLAPGSMPATARNLEEEGVVIPPSLLFEAGESRFDLIEDLFRAARYPSRSLADNLADLAAQAAANRHGVAAMEGLVAAWGTMTVRRNMRALFERASGVMDSRIASCPEGRWAASDVMDDGSPVCASLAVRDGRLLVDFEGSAEVHPGNLNATPAIVRSAVLYVMRAWVDEDIPLNEGLLESIELRLPAGMLNPDFGARPDECPAVVGGNVETSQRVVDVLLSALGLQANSQGTMNNLLFGNDRFGFYETLGGGSGAGPGWDGMNGTHVHMSNTAVTDPEVLEWRYPVRVREFSLRAGSGGEGRWRGGDGLVREIEFLEKMTVSILAQRRAVAPRGAEGGGSGTVGSQCLLRCGAPPRRIPCVASIEVEPGDRVRMETPGGGGWGIS
jgi:5-oxoprolinase (ATP-hydrolysing)